MCISFYQVFYRKIKWCIKLHLFMIGGKEQVEL